MMLKASNSIPIVSGSMVTSMVTVQQIIATPEELKNPDALVWTPFLGVEQVIMGRKIGFNTSTPFIRRIR